MPEQSKQPLEIKSPVLRLSQKELTDMFAKGEAQIVPTKEQSLVASEIKAWEAFLGKKLKEPIPSPPTELFEVLERAKAENFTTFEPHFLPQMRLSEISNYSGWKYKPEQWYWDHIRNRDINLLTSPSLGGKWILIDNTERPKDKNDMVYKNDPFQQSLIMLRDQLEQLKQIPSGSRFGISYMKLHEHFFPFLAENLHVNIKQIKLPKAIEFNIIGNIFHPEWHHSFWYEAFEDKFKQDFHLMGGSDAIVDDSNGLGNIKSYPSNKGSEVIAFRPLISFSKWDI